MAKKKKKAAKKATKKKKPAKKVAKKAKKAKKKAAPKKKAKKASAPKATASLGHEEGQDAMDHVTHEHEHEGGEAGDHEQETGVNKDEFGKEESDFENFDDDDDYGTPSTDEEESSDDEGYF